MPRRRSLLTALTCSALLVPGCLQRNWESYEALYGDSDDSGTTAASATDTADGWDTVSSVTITDSSSASATATTGAPEPTSTSTSGEVDPTASSTTAAPAGPPTILYLDLAPSPIHANGPINLAVEAEDTDRIDVVFDKGPTITLLPSADDENTFVGELPIYTGLDNGEHFAEFIPRRDDEVGESRFAPYLVDLPTPGSELFWEIDALSGVGIAGSLGVLPDGDIVELGTRYVAADEPRCYLRRRDPGGAWGPADVIELFPGSKCEAVDLEIALDGGLHVLLRRTIGNNKLWWAGSSPSWDATFETRGTGDPGEDAHALALAGETLAVCGTAPAEGDLDAFVQVFRPMQPGQRREFDFLDPDDEFVDPHVFDETPRDCVFLDESRLVVVGEVVGEFENKNVKASRRFVLEYDTLTDTAEEQPFVLHAAADALKSFAFAVAIGPFDDLLIVGSECDLDCPKGTAKDKLWVQTLGGAVLRETTLGTHAADNYSPSSVLWHPAHYALVANGTDSDTFLVRAVDPYSGEVLWTFARSGMNGLQLAFALALGEYGQVYAAGFGAGSFPAIAYIAG